MATFGTTAEGTGTSTSWTDTPFALLAALDLDDVLVVGDGVGQTIVTMPNQSGGSEGNTEAITEGPRA